MASQSPSKLIIATQVVGLILVCAIGVLTADTANWDPALFFILLAFSIFSDLTAISTPSKLKLSGSFLPMMLAMVFLGGPPAALIGLLTISVGWLGSRNAGHLFLNNVLAFMMSPLITGLTFHYVTTSAGITDSEPAFYALVLAGFGLALAINFTMIFAYSCYLDGSSFFGKIRTALVPILPSELAAALMAVGVVFLYVHVGLAGIALFGVVLITFQYLLGALLLSQQRAEELEKRSKQLASFQVGMLSAMLRTLDLRDQMTARHCAAVARYSRAIAQRAGYSRQEEELVHIAALLHDIGKFILPRPHPQGQRAAHRRGLDADQAPSPAGRPRGLLAGRLRPGGGDHPRPPRAGRRQRLPARPAPATTSRSWPASSPSPTPTT